MKRLIRRYEEDQDYDRLVELFKTEEDWSGYLEKDVVDKYRKSMVKSISYVLLLEDEIVGYSRSLEDIEMYIYVCDLLVNKKYRGRSFGKALLDRIKNDYPEHEIFVMSDVDEYYKKIGYKLEGSIFKL